MGNLNTKYHIDQGSQGYVGRGGLRVKSLNQQQSLEMEKVRLHTIGVLGSRYAKARPPVGLITVSQ